MRESYTTTTTTTTSTTTSTSTDVNITTTKNNNQQLINSFQLKSISHEGVLYYYC